MTTAPRDWYDVTFNCLPLLVGEREALIAKIKDVLPHLKDRHVRRGVLEDGHFRVSEEHVTGLQAVLHQFLNTKAINVKLAGPLPKRGRPGFWYKVSFDTSYLTTGKQEGLARAILTVFPYLTTSSVRDTIEKGYFEHIGEDYLLEIMEVLLRFFPDYAVDYESMVEEETPETFAVVFPSTENPGRVLDLVLALETTLPDLSLQEFKDCVYAGRFENLTVEKATRVFDVLRKQLPEARITLDPPVEQFFRPQTPAEKLWDLTLLHNSTMAAACCLVQDANGWAVREVSCFQFRNEPRYPTPEAALVAADK